MAHGLGIFIKICFPYIFWINFADTCIEMKLGMIVLLIDKNQHILLGNMVALREYDFPMVNKSYLTLLITKEVYKLKVY
jgi:hypothetical protein